MKHATRPLTLAALAVASLALGACDRASSRRTADAAESSAAVTPPAPRVRDVSLGNRSDSTLRVPNETTQFHPRDTMYLAVEVLNPDASSELSARWTFEDGTVMDSSAQNVARDMAVGTSITQFRVWRDKGWALGTYSVTIWLNDQLVDTRTMSVRR